MSRLLLADKLSFLVSTIAMIIGHASTGHWSAELGGGLIAGGFAVGAIVRSIIRADEREARERFLRDEWNRGERMSITPAEKSLITAMRDDERKELR